jgi:hypothetical protein
MDNTTNQNNGVEILEAEQNIDDGENFGGNDEGNSEMQV